MHCILVYCGSEIINFIKNASKFLLRKNIFANNPHRQEKGVAWQHFRDKAKRHIIHENITLLHSYPFHFPNYFYYWQNYTKHA